MKKLLLLLIISTVLTSCRIEKKSERIEKDHLYKDLTYAHPVNFVRPRERAFEFKLESPRFKKFPAILQTQPGSISFYRQLKVKPVLSFSLDFLSRKASNLETKVILESDDPPQKKEYAAAASGYQEIDLREFQGRIVRITLLAKSQNLIGLGGTLYWIDPVLQQENKQPNAGYKKSLHNFRERHRKNNVLLFLLDATNPSHLGCYGYSRSTSPVIDSVAAQGVVWDHAVSQAVSTVPSTGSLLTGLYPEAHGILEKRSVLPKSFPTMAEAFREGGFRTALFTANPNASRVTGYDQGFEFVWHIRQGRIVSAHEFVQPFRDWLTRVKNQQFFAYLHIREPHWPYDPPQEFLKRFYDGIPAEIPESDPFVVPPPEEKRRIIAAYDSNIAYADLQLGRMLGYVRELGIDNNTIIVILSDHGEAFWQHGKQGHNYHVYENTARIPLIIRFPGEPELRGRREPYVVGSIDLFPTFVDLFSFSRKELLMNGQSLLPFLLGNPFPDDVFRLTQTGNRTFYSARSSKYKYIHHPQERKPQDEFFALVTDPEEKNNVIRDLPITSTFYRIQIQKTLSKLEMLRSTKLFANETEAVIDQQTEEELRALGYVN